jgi:hypothetical protein
MSATPKSIGSQQKRKLDFVDISPIQALEDLHAQKRLDNKASPQSATTSTLTPTLEKSAVPAVLNPDIPNPLTPDWAGAFQAAFFCKTG